MRNTSPLILLLLLYLFLFSGLPDVAIAQENSSDSVLAGNTIFFEYGGSSSGISANYERLIAQRVPVRAGVSFVTILGSNHIMIPATTGYLIRVADDSFFELGTGITFFRSNIETRPIVTSNIGFRQHPAGRGFFNRIGVFQYYSLENSAIEVFIWGGVSIGFSF